MAEPKKQKCRVAGCGLEFDTSYELSMHIAAAHQVDNKESQNDLSNPAAPQSELPPVVIRTTRKVDLCLPNGVRFFGVTELTVPYQQAEDAKRVLVEAYERDGGARILAE